MNRKLLIVLCALCLTACGPHIVRDGAPANDLNVLQANVRKDGSPVLLPNGKEYCAEIARTEDEQDDCLGDLEDALFNANRRGERQVETVEKFVARERLRRNPCGFFRSIFFRSKCEISRVGESKNSATPR